MARELKRPKTRTWRKSAGRISLREILERIAAEHGLKLRLGQGLESLDFEVANQTNESDPNLLTRLGREYDAVAKPAGGFLIFATRGRGKSASGLDLPTMNLTPKDVLSWSSVLAERKDYRTVVARYHDPSASDNVAIQAGEGEPIFTIRQPFKDAATATQAAAAKLEEFTRGKSKLSLEAPGNSSLVAEAKLSLTGFRTGVDGPWTIESATHRFTNQGYTTALEASIMTS